MKQFLRGCAVAVVALFGVGCDSKPAEIDPAGGDGGGGAALFKRGQGIWFTEETKTLLGVEVAEVGEQPIRRRATKTAQVYRAADGNGAARALIRLSTNESSGLRIGANVGLTTSQGGWARMTGRLTFLDTQTLPLHGEVEALVEFPDSEHRFAVGDLLDALFEEEIKSGLAVPESALIHAADGSYVYSVNGTRLTRTLVEPGRSSNGFVSIESGLYAGDFVASKGAGNLWLVELSALKGGTPCCPAPKKTAGK